MADKEYIEREALLNRMESRLTQLRADYGSYDAYTNGFEEGLVAVEDAVAADVVGVVRCKNCVHWGGVTFGFVCRKFIGIIFRQSMGLCFERTYATAYMG